MSLPPAWFIGFFFTAIIGLTEAMNDRGIVEYEIEICQPRKLHLHVDGCNKCVCRDHGYGSICRKDDRCLGVIESRPVEFRECVPYDEFQTRCHYCRCSQSGTPIGCIERRRGCMEEFFEELDQEQYIESQGQVIHKDNWWPTNKR